MLAIIHSTGPFQEDLQLLAHRRLLALLTLAWEHNRRLALRLLDFADKFRQRAGSEYARWHPTVMQLQLLSSFGRARALELKELLRARGGRLLVRLPAKEPFEEMGAELARISDLGRLYGSALDIAMTLERDLELVERIQHHVDELADLARQLAVGNGGVAWGR